MRCVSENEVNLCLMRFFKHISLNRKMQLQVFSNLKKKKAYSLAMVLKERSSSLCFKLPLRCVR